MPPKKTLGPTGEHVAQQVSHARGRMQYKELAEKLESLGRPIPPLGLRRIETGERRVDVDDLMALAIALNVAPVDLLLPPASSSEAVVTGLASPVPADRLYYWARGEASLSEAGNAEFYGAIYEKGERRVDEARAAVRREERRLEELKLELQETAKFEDGHLPAGMRPRHQIEIDLDLCRTELALAEVVADRTLEQFNAFAGHDEPV